jgi:hypothetical protein
MRSFVSIAFKMIVLTFYFFGISSQSIAQNSAQNQASSQTAASAQVSATNNAKVPRKQTLNFEDELVQGSAQKPDLFYLFQRKDMNQGRLIKLRQNFLPEMRKTAEDVQRVRGGH